MDQDRNRFAGLPKHDNTVGSQDRSERSGSNFKTGAPGHPRWAGSIPVRLRFRCAAARSRTRLTRAISPADASGALRRVRFPSASARGPDQGFSHLGQGASGVVLDSLYLNPLGIEREECWITDLVQSYLANDGQLSRISKSYEPLVDEGIVPAARLRRRAGKVTHLPDYREESLRRELEEASPELVITLGNEPLQCLGLDPLDPSSYGTEREVPVLGSSVRLLALVHPRQSGALGQSSPKWTAAHREWVASVGRA